MEGWKSATFTVPWLLQKTTNLGGSKHDKDKEDWEKKRKFCVFSLSFAVKCRSPLEHC